MCLAFVLLINETLVPSLFIYISISYSWPFREVSNSSTEESAIEAGIYSAKHGL